MPRFNFTFQEASPLITYAGGLWTEGNPSNDSSANGYDGGFRVTNDANATATLIFTGTGVTLFGGKRGNHGNYSVEMDHGSPELLDGNVLHDAFNVSLWNTYGLKNEQHTVEITNNPSPSGPYFDLDFVTIERMIGQENDMIFQTTIDNSSPFAQYNGMWQSDSLAPANNNGMLITTTSPNSQLSLTFRGCCIELYGLYANAAYTVSLDNQAPVPMQGMDVDLPAEMWHPNTLLYLMDGLSTDVNHTVVLNTTQTSLNRPFYFDYALVRSTHQFLSDSSPFASSPSPDPPENHSSIPVAAIVGASLGGAIILILVATGLILLRRHRREPLRVDLAAEMDPHKPQAARTPRPFMNMAPARRGAPSTFQLTSVFSGWHGTLEDDENSTTGSSWPSTLGRSRTKWARASVTASSTTSPESESSPAQPRDQKSQLSAVSRSPSSSSRYSQRSTHISKLPC